jgi:hypothetical protein
VAPVRAGGVRPEPSRERPGCLVRSWGGAGAPEVTPAGAGGALPGPGRVASTHARSDG